MNYDSSHWDCVKWNIKLALDIRHLDLNSFKVLAFILFPLFLIRLYLFSKMNALRLSTIPPYSVSVPRGSCIKLPSTVVTWFFFFPFSYSPQLSFLFSQFCTLIHFPSPFLLDSPLLFSLQPPFPVPRCPCRSLAHFTSSFCPSSLLLFFSMRRWRFSSRRRASSTSWCCRHLWKFSTTTPTNMLSTKKLTIRRKEMK